MPANRRNVFETIRDKRLWHSPPDAEAAKLDFRGWHSRGYLPHLDTPGLVQFINYRLDDAMPTSLHHEWSALLEIDDELKRRSKIEDLDRGCGGCLLRDPRAATVVEETTASNYRRRPVCHDTGARPPSPRISSIVWNSRTSLSALRRRWD